MRDTSSPKSPVDHPDEASPTHSAAQNRRAAVLASKRQRILEEATYLFYTRGYERTTIDAIADRFGMTKPAVYYHFESKAQLLDAVCLQVIESCLDALDEGARSEGTDLERLERALRRFVTVVIRMRANTAVFFREVKHLSPEAHVRTGRLRRDFDQRLAKLIDAARAAGQVQVRDPQFASLAIGGMVSWLYTWYREGQRLTEQEVVDLMVDAAFRVVGAGTDSPAKREARTPAKPRSR